MKLYCKFTFSLFIDTLTDDTLMCFQGNTHLLLDTILEVKLAKTKY